MHKANQAMTIFPAVAIMLLLALPVQAGTLRQGRGFTLMDAQAHAFTLADVVPPLEDRAPRMAAEAWLRQALAEEGWQVRIVARTPDRYGRQRARVLRKDADLATRMIAAGQARVGFDIPDPARARALLAAEAEARAAGRGLWAGWQPLAFADAGAQAGRYGLVEGRIQRVETHKGHVFLAFGEDWRSDPTGFIPAAAVPRFTGLDALAGKNVRLRGWIEEKNGPSMLLVQPYAVEVLP
jgi:hypothetical protein